MARARNIKPGFFKNEQLAELPFSTRLLFIGLWTLADREGLLEDRPKRIKMEVFPGDNVDIEKSLDELEHAEFIHRYVVDGKRYICILKFKEHQNPHYKEAQSTIPKPEVELPIIDSKTRGNEADDRQENPRQARGKPEADPPTKGGQTVLIPDSLIPDSGFPSTPPSEPAVPDCPQQALIALYAKHLPTLTQPRLWAGNRVVLMRDRWKQCSKPNGVWPGYKTQAEGLEFWEQFFAGVAQSPKLANGIPRSEKDGGGIWKPDLPWLLKLENFIKVIEGRYHDA